MTSKYLVTLLGYAVLLVLRSVVGEECSQDISNENCSLTTHNNEIEALSPQHTQEITTHAPELITTMTSLNAATENSVENTFRPMITESVSSSTPSATNSTESSTSNIMEDSTLNSSETSTVNTMKSVTTTINLPATLTSNMIEHSTTNSSEASTAVSLETTTTTTSNALEVSALNITEAPMLNMSETLTLNTMELDESSNLTVANLSDISTLHIAEVLISNSSDMTVSNPSNSSVSNSSETLTSFSTDTSTSNETDMSTLSAISHSNSSEISTSNSSESFTFLNVMEGEELPDTSTPNLIDTSILNSSETSTSNLMEDSTSNLMQATTLDSMETTETSATNSVKKSMPYVLESSSSSMETSTSNLSEISTPTVMETTTLKQMESSTSHIPMDMVHSSDASTSNFIDTVTETSVDSSADTSNHHSTETSTDLLTTENLTEVSTDNPTENAMNEEATTAATTNAADEPKGRSLNFSVEEENPNNVLSNISHHHDDNFELNDAQVHDDDDFNVDVDSLDSKILAPKNQIHNSSQIVCEKGGLTYENGEKLELGCESVCTCRDGKMDCTDRCVGPYFRRGKKIDDPYCTAKEVEDPCCSVLVCAGDTETEPLEICSYENKTYNRGDTFNKSCTEICTCEIAGKISCKPRCPPITKTSDRCVEVPDPNDFCCLKVLCDVTLDEHDTEKDEEKSKPKLFGAKYVNMSAILLTFESHAKYDDNENLPIIEVSNDKSNWDYYKLLPGGIVFVKDKFRYLKIENTNDVVEVEDTELASPDQLHIPSEADLALQLDTEHNLHPSTEHLDNAATCSYKGKTFEDGEEYNDECRFLCKCQNEEMKCLKMECPTYFGVDVLDPNCIEWETIPPDFVPSPPKCCPDKVHCKNNGSCDYEGRTYKNWDLIPSNITGCEKKCYCEMNNVECENICPPVTALPPPTLDCPPHLAMVSHIPDDDCCKYWVCNKDDHTSGNDGQILPESYPDMTHQHPQEDIVIQSLQPVDPHKVRLSFTVPSIIVGLHGRFEVRYTHNKDEKDLDSWMLTVFAPPNDLIATPSLEFDLTDLKADTEYSIKITVTLRDLHNMPSSKIYKVKTPKEVEPPVIPIDPDLAITDINATWVTVIWKAFTQYQLQFIDGIQLRYKEIDGRIYTATPLIHRAVTRYTLEKLKPNTKYEIGIYFIPFPGQMTELHAKNILHFTTANEIDTYGFNVTLEISNVKSQSVEISWNGVPYPEDKYVNIYRAIYQSDSSKEDYSTFKMAKRDSPTRTIIKDLKPGTRYRLWLEVYLTNGKIKTSNVEDFITKTRPLLAPALGASTQQDKLSRAEVLETKGDYYGPLVIVAILAAIAILSTLILLLILVRRHNQNKAAITPPSTRISQSAYDNPTYKVEIQQETMGL